MSEEIPKVKEYTEAEKEVLNEQRKEFDALKHYNPTEGEGLAIINTEKYPGFLDIRETTKEMRDILKETKHSQEFKNEMEQVLFNLERSAEFLERSHKNQKEYNLVDKRWMRGPDFMKEALEKGRLAMELDVRMDKDGKFWVSHATGAKTSATPPFIHEMTSEEMEEKGERFSLEDAFKIFSEYNDGNHKLILELKTLGGETEKFSEVVENLKKLIDADKLEDAIAVSSLSPGILMSVHETYPEMPLILNGGIVPGISYERPKEKKGILEKLIGKLKDKIIPADKKWRAFGVTLPWLGKPSEVVISASEKSPIRPDGEGTQTGYALTRLPDDLVKVLQKQREEGKEFGGMVSLSAVTILASVLDAVGATEKATEMRRYYNEVVDQLKLGKMATTWGQGLSKLPVVGKTLFKKLSPEHQIDVFKRELGLDVMVYTKAPEEFAHLLKNFTETYGELRVRDPRRKAGA